MPVLIKGAGGGGMKVNGAKVRAVAAGEVTAGNFLDYVPRTLYDSNIANAYIGERYSLSGGYFATYLYSSGTNYLCVFKLNQVTGEITKTETLTVSESGYSVSVFQLTETLLIKLKYQYQYGTTYVLYQHSEGHLTQVASGTISTTYTIDAMAKISDTEFMFSYYESGNKILYYKMATLNGTALTFGEQKNVQISVSGLIGSRHRFGMSKYLFGAPKAMVIIWQAEYYDRDGNHVPSSDLSGMQVYMFDAAMNLTKTNEINKTYPNCILETNAIVRKNCMLVFYGSSVENKYEKLVKTQLNNDGSLTEIYNGICALQNPQVVNNQSAKDGDDIYSVRAFDHSLAVYKHSWIGTDPVFQWVRKDKDKYLRYRNGLTVGSYGVQAAAEFPKIEIVNGARRLVFECTCASTVSASSYNMYDRYGTIPIDTAYNVKNADYNTEPTTTNGVLRLQLIALENAAANQEFSAMVADEKDAIEYAT